MWQAQHAVDRLQHKHPNLECRLVPIVTQGDKIVGPLHQAGGKGLFSKDIHEAMLRGEIDCAVHSLKDVETVADATDPWRSSPADARLSIAAVWQVGTSMDVLVSCANDVHVVASGSMRRRDQLAHMWPSVRFVAARGNVVTRLKLISDEVDATVLAGAGLERLGLWRGGNRLESPFEHMLVTKLDIIPAAGQGVLAMDALDNDVKKLLSEINDVDCAQLRWIERRVLQLLGADCHTSIGLKAGPEDVEWFYKGAQGSVPQQVNRADTARRLYTHLIRK